MTNDDRDVPPPPVPVPPAVPPPTPPAQEPGAELASASDGLDDGTPPSPAAPASRQQRLDAARASARRVGAGARRHAGWLAVAALATLAIVVLLVGRLSPDAEAQSTDSVAAWETDLAAYQGTVAALTATGGQVDASTVAETGLVSGDLLQQSDGIDLSPVSFACSGADAAIRLSRAGEGIAIPVLGPGDASSYAYEDAQAEADALEDSFAAAATYADDVAALDGSLGAACALATRLSLPVSYLQYASAPIEEGETAQVGETTTVVCAGAQGCPTGPGPTPTWEWGSLADSHRELADAFDGTCPTELDEACALAADALRTLAADDGTVLTAWAVANDDDATADELQALQTALDERASRFEAAWADAEAAAPGGDIEAALATILTEGLGELGDLVQGIQAEPGY